MRTSTTPRSCLSSSTDDLLHYRYNGVVLLRRYGHCMSQHENSVFLTARGARNGRTSELLVI